ncbi:MAG: hypothetical protein Q9176_004478 [Flavoplaca citrina]
MEPIPGSALSRFSLIDRDGYVHGTSVHFLSKVHQRNRNQLAASGGTVNPAHLSVLGKRKDDGAEDEDAVSRQQPGKHRGRPSKRPRPHAPGEHGFDPNTHPFGWFTQAGHLPLDSNPDITWTLQDGRYFGYRISTREKDPFVEPQLITTGTAGWAVAHAKQELGRQKRRITGNPYTRWNDQLHSASLSQPTARPRGSTAAQSQNPPSNQVPASVPHQPVPTFNPRPGVASSSIPSAGQSSTAPLIFPPSRGTDNSQPSNHDDESDKTVHASFLTSDNGYRSSDTTSAPGGDFDPCKLRGDNSPVKRTPSAGAHGMAPRGPTASSRPTEHAKTMSAKAGSSELEPGTSIAAERTSRSTVTQSQIPQNLIERTVQNVQIETVIDNMSRCRPSKKRGRADESVEVANPKRTRVNTVSTSISRSNLPRPSNVPKHELPYNQEDHMIDRKQPSKRKSTGDPKDEPKSKKMRVTKEPSANSSTTSSKSSNGPLTTTDSTSLNPPQGLIRTYTASARRKAKNDPCLKILIEQADKLANSLPKAPEEPRTTSSFEHNGKLRQVVQSPPEPSIRMTKTDKEVIAESPAAMPIPEKLEKHRDPSEFLAEQRLQIAQAFESKASGKGQKEERPAKSPLTTTFTKPSAARKVRKSSEQGKERSREGSVPAVMAFNSRMRTSASAVSSIKAARREPEVEQSGSARSSSVNATRDSSSQQSGLLPAAASFQASKTTNAARTSYSSMQSRGHESKNRGTGSIPPSSANTDTNLRASRASQVPKNRPAAASPPQALTSVRTASGNRQPPSQIQKAPTYTRNAATSTNQSSKQARCTDASAKSTINNLSITMSGLNQARAGPHPPHSQPRVYAAPGSASTNRFSASTASHQHPRHYQPNTGPETYQAAASQSLPAYAPPPQASQTTIPPSSQTPSTSSPSTYQPSPEIDHGSGMLADLEEWIRAERQPWFLPSI